MGSFGLCHPKTKMGNGPASFVGGSDWTEITTNDLAHFVQIGMALNSSRWFRDGVQWSVDNDGKTLDFENPDVDAIVSAVTLIRQFLLRRDKVFERAVDAYKIACGDGGKVLFVETELGMFQQGLGQKLHGMYHQNDTELQKLTVQRLIDLVVYGSGLFHRKSNENLEVELGRLVANSPREKILFAFHGCCRSAVQHAFCALPVIEQDFSHWCAVGDFKPQTRIVLRGFFDDIPITTAKPLEVGERRITWKLSTA